MAKEDGLFVSGTLGLLSPLAAGESMDGYPASPASLGAGLNQQVEHTLPSQRANMTGPVIQSGQIQAEQAGTMLAQSKNLVISEESEEGVENAYQEMVSLAFDICSHWPSIESLIVPQARLHQIPTISARLSCIQRRIEWLKTLKAKSAPTNSQRQYSDSANAEPMYNGAIAMFRQQPSNLASSAMTTQQSVQYVPVSQPVQYPPNSLLQGASLVPDSLRLPNRKRKRKVPIPFQQLPHDAKKFSIPGVEPRPPGQRRKGGSPNDSHEEMFSWCVHYVRLCAETGQAFCVSARSLEENYVGACGRAHGLSSARGRVCPAWSKEDIGPMTGYWFSLSDVFDVAEREWKDIFDKVPRAQLISKRSAAKTRSESGCNGAGGGGGGGGGGSDASDDGAEHAESRTRRCFINTNKLSLIVFLCVVCGTRSTMYVYIYKDVKVHC